VKLPNKLAKEYYTLMITYKKMPGHRCSKSTGAAGKRVVSATVNAATKYATTKAASNAKALKAAADRKDLKKLLILASLYYCRRPI
jgi:hypothetical protein